MLQSAKKFWIFIFYIFVSSTQAQAQAIEGSRAAAYGQDHIFSLKAPQGWLMDTQSCASWGVGFCLYPTNTKLRDSVVIMYARGISKKESKYTSEQDLIEFTVNDFHNSGSPNYRVDAKSVHKIENYKNATVVFYSGDQNGNYEAVGYLNEEASINYIVMTSKTKKAFEESLPAFYKVLESYQFETELPACAKMTC